jgi:FlaA1/EpsC-like NDP-sugar epimerase
MTLRTLVVGAGQAGRALARDLQRNACHGLLPIGFVDDALNADTEADPTLPVLGPLREVARLVTEYQAEAVALAIPGLAPDRTREVTDAAVAAGAVVRYLPWFMAASSRGATGSDLRPLDIRSLIRGPEAHVVSPEVKEIIAGKRVLVTGAGGAIGSELCRQVYPFNPGALYPLDQNEAAFLALRSDVHGEFLVADIRDRGRVHEVFRHLRPEVVFHAAGPTQASLLERRPSEAVKTNVAGTDNLVHAATRFGTERFVLISTEADPASVLGASQRVAELIVQSAAHDAREQGTEAVFTTVRVGAALNPHDSLLTTLPAQIRAGGPVTITHPNSARCFASIEEAVGLALEAARAATGGESHTLDLGEPVTIAETVARFTRQYRLPDVPVRFVGRHRGEEQPQTHTAIADVDPAEYPKLPARLEKLYSAALKNRDPRVRQMLMKLASGS